MTMIGFFDFLRDHHSSLLRAAGFLTGQTKKMDKEIYLKKEEIKLGCGSTSKATLVVNYYQVTEVDDNHVALQILDFNDQPMGKAEVMEKERLKEFIYCPDYFKSKKSPKELNIENHVQSGDGHFERREYFSAEHEYNKALSLDDQNLKANLGKGKSLFARGEREEAKKIFSKLSNLSTLFEVENKHVFNEFGIELRKRGMFEEAITNYLKSISIDPNDEVLYYNLGRAYYEKGEIEKSAGQLKKAMMIKPGFKEAEQFLLKIES